MSWVFFVLYFAVTFGSNKKAYKLPHTESQGRLNQFVLAPPTCSVNPPHPERLTLFLIRWPWGDKVLKTTNSELLWFVHWAVCELLLRKFSIRWVVKQRSSARSQYVGSAQRLFIHLLVFRVNSIVSSSMKTLFRKPFCRELCVFVSFIDKSSFKKVLTTRMLLVTACCQFVF